MANLKQFSVYEIPQNQAELISGGAFFPGDEYIYRADRQLIFPTQGGDNRSLLISYNQYQRAVANMSLLFATHGFDATNQPKYARYKAQMDAAASRFTRAGGIVEGLSYIT